MRNHQAIAVHHRAIDHQSATLAVSAEQRALHNLTIDYQRNQFLLSFSR
ncbi:hypothetical protein ACKFKF_04885 [Phormidesmis sp. 146-12]